MQLRVSGAAFLQESDKQITASVRLMKRTEAGTRSGRSDRNAAPENNDNQEKTKEEFVPG